MAEGKSRKRRGWAYLRMSDKSQEGSIEQQRAEILKLAEREGIEIVAWYVDEGKSGSKNQEKREHFHRMLADARRAATGEVDYVLTWNTSRFGRQDTIDSAYAKSILREKGVCLLTVKDGLIDWNTFQGRITDAIFSELNHLYSQNLAADSLRGRAAVLEAGFWPNGSVPYGYDRLYISPGGEEKFVRRAETFRKPSKAWMLRLVINEAEAEVVRRIFREYADRDRSFRDIAADLNRDAVPSPQAAGGGSGTAWTVSQAIEIMTNPAYLGIGYLGVGARRCVRNKPRLGKFATAGGLRKAGVCPVIVEPALWEEAHARRDSKKRDRRRSGKVSEALSGCVYCAACGHRMFATRRAGKVRYSCNTSTMKPGVTGCKKWSAAENELLPIVCSEVVRLVDGEVLKVIQARPEEPARTDLEHLLDVVRAKEKEVERAADNYLKAADDLRDLLADRLRQLRDELADLKERYQLQANLANEAGLKHFVDWWQEVRPGLLATAQGAPLPLDGATVTEDDGGPVDEEYIALEGQGEPLLTTPDRLRSLLHRLGCKAACHFAATGSRKKTTPGKGSGPAYILSKVVVTLNTGDTDGRSRTATHLLDIRGRSEVDLTGGS